MEPLLVKDDVVVPAHAFAMRAVRSSGPGGQNVNKVASKVELRVDLRCIEGLEGGARLRLRVLCENALDAEGALLVTSQRTRDQRQNIEDAREKVRILVLRAMVKPTPRRPTKPSRGSIERRIGEKKNRARIKADRAHRD